jgi:hypothetical protein
MNKVFTYKDELGATVDLVGAHINSVLDNGPNVLIWFSDGDREDLDGENAVAFRKWWKKFKES